MRRAPLTSSDYGTRRCLRSTPHRILNVLTLAVSLPVLEQIAEALGIAPEVAVLACMKARYSAFSNSKAGPLVEKLVNKLKR